MPTGLRLAVPVKITSCILPPRNWRALDSPITQRIASMTLDLPQPLGPTTAVRFFLNCKVVLSAKDLKPESFKLLKRIMS